MAWFEQSTFWGLADFRNVQFPSFTTFNRARFNAPCYFSNAVFQDLVSFQSAEFNCPADLRNVDFRDNTFGRAVINSKIFLGSSKPQKYDFNRTILTQKAQIVLSELVDLDIQNDRARYIALSDTITYHLKRLIIDYLKDGTFSKSKKAQFELEYIFSKSTMFQEEGRPHSPKRIYHIAKWPKWAATGLYYVTMGLGYRPFRLVWWALGFVVIFAGVYYGFFRPRIGQFIHGPKFKRGHPLDDLIDCAYFSCMLFFGIRLKRDLLPFFKKKEKWLIVGEWVLGFLIYIAFLTLSKSGSILHTLKSLFVG